MRLLLKTSLIMIVLLLFFSGCKTAEETAASDSDERELIRKSVANEVATRSFDIDGYMVQYRKDTADPYVWLYISKSTKLVYKLNGLKTDGTFDWVRLEDAPKDIHSFDRVEINSDRTIMSFGNAVIE